MASSTPKALVGVIGGSGLYKMDNLTAVEEVNPETPWGFPSSPITIASLPSGTHIAFLARHGPTHSINPSAVPSRANIAALSSLGVKAIIAFSAVGSLREEIAPGDFIIPDQIIDRTKSIRPASFFEGTSVVAHAMFGDPFDGQLVEAITPLVKGVLDAVAKEGEKKDLHTGKTVVCMEGPQFSTRAESKMYRLWGGDIINMSVLPESKLAREAEISYALIATSTDYDAWRINEHPVTVAEVLKTLHSNAETSRRVAGAILEHVHELVNGEQLKNAAGSMAYSIVTQPENQKEEDRVKLRYILPKYFS